MQTFRYGPAPSQVGDLYLPDSHHAPVVCLLHGGFWRMPYGRDELDAIAVDLVGRGWAVWNLEYRRVGEAGAGWPGTLLDVSRGIDHLTLLDEAEAHLDLNRVVVAGHSAGGHLALWSAAEPPASGALARTRRVRPAAVASLAGISDLQAAYHLNAGSGAVGALVGGAPDEFPDRYGAASPVGLLPLGVPQLILHGTSDQAVPVQLARDYVTTATRVGEPIVYREFPDGGHMEYVDPASDVHAELCAWLLALRAD